ncbi:MAG: ATP-binding protein [Actinobacteria bacterium]|nr:ATP-binding protein [Actinomycetota bacterium]
MTNDLNIKKPKDTVQDALKLVVYGDSGVGKTVFGSTAPKPLYISCEAGLLSIADKNIDVVEIGTWPDLVAAFELLKSGSHPYKSVVLDSLTELQKKHQDYLLSKNGQPRLSMQGWGDNIQATRKVCRTFRDLPMNVILIALAGEIAGEDGSGTPRKRFALNGKDLPNEVMGFFDLVGYMFTRDEKDDAGQVITKRAIRFQSNEFIPAKDRSGKLDSLEPPNFMTIYDKVFANGKKEGAAK